MKNLPDFIQEKLKLQEKALTNSTKTRKKFSQLSFNIANKVNKAPEDLITGDLDNFRIKKEIKELIENEKPEQFGTHSW